MQASPSKNSPCPCGSGKKFKRCCGKDQNGQSTVSIQHDQIQNIIKLYQQGNLQAAGHLAKQQLARHPDDVGLIEMNAVITLQTGDTEQAVRLFKMQLDVQPDNALAHSNLCMALHSLNQDEEAFQHGQQAIDLDPKLADAWNNLGNIYKAGNHLEGALEHYEKALKIDNSDPLVHINAGTVSQLLGDLETAEKRYRDAIRIHPDFAAAHNNLGTVLQRKERYDEAEKSFQRALKLQPGNPETLTNLGLFLLDRGKIDEARQHFESALHSNPDYIGAYVSLGGLYEKLGNRDQADKYYDKVLLLDTDNSTALCNIAYNLFEQGDQEEAVEHFIRALKKDPNSAKGLAGLGKAMLRQEKIGKASEYINKALKLAPWDVNTHIAKAHLDTEQGEFANAVSEWKYVIEHHPEISDGYIGLATHYQELGQYDEARAQFEEAENHEAADFNLYHSWSAMEEHVHRLDDAEKMAKKAVELDPGYPGLAILRAKLARRRKNFEEALEILQQVNPDNITRKQVKASYLFELGSLLDKLGRYDEAFTAYDEANQAKNRYRGSEYNLEEDRQRFKRFQSFYSAKNWETLRKLQVKPDNDRHCPVFIVGFPRSGTSLLEQILGSHPQIAPAGELEFMTEIANREAPETTNSQLPYPDFLLDKDNPLDPKTIKSWRDYYLSRVAELGVTDDKSSWVTDKMPHNAIHLGLISLLFPESPIIHISRHPLNCCLSAYFSNFKTGHRYTSSLKSTAEHYKLVMEMVNHYRSLGINFLEVHYEDLVKDQKSVTRKILEYIGAPWDDACLQHHKSDRVVATASYEQVTQKIYESSLYRYRNYKNAVKPIIPILESTITQFGYSTD